MTTQQAILALLIGVLAFSQCQASPNPKHVSPVLPSSDQGAFLRPSPVAPVSDKPDSRSIIVYSLKSGCPGCEAMKPEIQALREAGWALRVSYDLAEATAAKVELYPTSVCIKNGREIDRVVGYIEATALGERANRD